METISVARHHDDRVAEIMLNRPEAMNSISTELAVAITRACADVAAAPDGATLERGVRPAAARVDLSITDNGPGIPPEVLPELFERFTRADTSRARDRDAAGKSTGLGLAIVDAVVAAHGGSITVTSRPGRTRFAIYLPLLPEPADMADIAG